MARLQRAVLVLAFLAVCGGMMVFLLQFTESAPSFDYPLWEEGAVVAADGTETSFDPNGAVPSLADGDHYRFSMTLPEERAPGQWLIFDAAGLETTVSLAGTTLWQSSAVQDGATMNLSQVQLALPAGGEELTMTVRPLSETVVMPPFPRLSYEPTDQAGAIAYANHYGIPAGISALALVLLWGLFLLEWAQGRKNWRLLLPMFAGAALTVHQLAIGFGGYFLSDRLMAVCSGRWLTVLAPLALVLFLALHREGRFWRALGWVTLWSLVALGLATAISYWRGGYLAMYLHNQLEALATHYYDGLLYWFTLWLVLVCTLLAAWAFVRTTAQTQAEAQAMALKMRSCAATFKPWKRVCAATLARSMKRPIGWRRWTRCCGRAISTAWPKPSPPGRKIRSTLRSHASPTISPLMPFFRMLPLAQPLQRFRFRRLFLYRKHCRCRMKISACF